MQLKFVRTTERGATDRLLAALALRLEAEGIQTAGIVQTNTECYDDRLCDMDVRVLPGKEVIRISQSLGPDSRGCRLDPGALERAVGLVTQGLDANPAPQILIVNKFGKHEADGRGMRPVIAAALERGLPVLTGVNGLNLDRFMGFAEGIATEAEPDLDTLVAWAREAVRESA